MRIVSGKYKGRIITPPKKLPVRPTTDLAKESLFNILNSYLDFDDIEVLDLFSGTGNLTYEFVSRGCKSVDLVEKDFGCIRFIKQTIEKLNIDNVNVIKQDVFKVLKTWKKQYDLIFADPPYGIDNLDSIPTLVFNSGILKDQGLLILEHPRDYNFSESPGFLEHRSYGSVNFSFFSFTNPNP
jgi:16S rRNA (guanine(966)-N(2))-methyltransferase RsmD